MVRMHSYVSCALVIRHAASVTLLVLQAEMRRSWFQKLMKDVEEACHFHLTFWTTCILDPYWLSVHQWDMRLGLEMFSTVHLWGR